MSFFKKAIIDSCVLIDALMINYIRISTNSILNKKWEHILYETNNLSKKNYNDFLENIKTFVTTSHVIGELNGLVNNRLDLKDSLKVSFWANSVSYLKFKNLDEKLIQLFSISENISYNKFIFQIGIVDTGLIELAKDEDLTIITKDSRTLVARAKEFSYVKIFNPLNHFKNNIY